MTPARRGLGRDALHLIVLWSFAVAQPLLSVLGHYPAFFAAHRVGSSGIVVFALVLLVGPPLLLAGAEAVAGLALGEQARRVLHLFFAGALVAVFALPIVAALPAGLAYGLALGVGGAAAYVYARFPAARAFAGALAFAPALFLVAFLFFSNAFDRPEAFGPPVVFLQFDAFPVLLAETPDHRIDPVRFPHLAALSRDAAWYRNVSNVHENTVFSIPSILTGRFPRKGTKPVVQDWGESLFTLLGPTHRMNVTEEATSLCPPGYCHPHVGAGRVSLLADDLRVVFNHILRPDSERGSLPTTKTRWSQYASPPVVRLFTHTKSAAHIIRHLSEGRLGRFHHWLGGIRGGGVPDLDFIHMFMPHEPRVFLPDGKRYVPPDTALEGPPAYDNRFLSDQEMQRVILQIGFTDRIVGRVVERLKQLGVYDRTMIVLLADHGESFDVKPTPAGPFVPGHLGFRRAATPRNIEDIASIPLFIKYPKGRGPQGADDRFVRSLDVMPTIAQVVRRPLAQPVDGTSLLAPGYRGHDKVVEETTFAGPVIMGVAGWQARRERSLRRRLALFGFGRQSVFAWGRYRSMVGRPVTDFAVVPSTTARATVDGAGALASVDPKAPVCLCLIAGRIAGARPEGMPLAIAVNGRIAATAEGFAARGAKRLNWSAMIPPGAYGRGRNVVRVFRIQRGRLATLGQAP